MNSPEALQRPIIIPQRNTSSTGWWTLQRTERLTEAWNGGQLSASQIAVELGSTRNAIIGKAHRIGLCAKAPPLGPRKPKVPREPRAKLAKVLPFRMRSTFRPDLPVALHPPDNPPVKLVDLEFHHCRYIVGRDEEAQMALYCAGPKTPHSESYCVYHWRLCYNLDAPKRIVMFR